VNRAETNQTTKTVSSAASILWFASSNLFRQLLNIGTAFLRPLLLTPELFGLFSMLRLIPTYAHHIHLGARNTLRYRIPDYEAHGETEQIDRLRYTVLTGTAVIALAVSLALLLAALLLEGAGPEVRIGLAICAGTVIVISIYDNVLAELKGFQLFRVVGLQNYFSALVTLVVGGALIWWFGFYGAMLTELIVLLVMLVVLARRGYFSFRLGFDLALFRSAVAFGAPTLLFDASLVLMRTTDRLVIAGTMGLEQLGYYALGSIVLAYVMHVPGATREVMEGKFFQYERTHDIEALFEIYVLKPIRVMAFAMPVLIGPAVILLPFVIGLALPSYVQGVAAMQALMIGGFFLAISFPLRGMLVSSGRQIKAVWVLLGSIGLHAGLSCLLVWAGFGIVGVAASAGVAFLCSGAGLMLLVVGALPRRPANLGWSLLVSLVPFPLMIGGLVMADRIGATIDQSTVVQLAVQLAVYGLFIGAAGLVAVRVRVIPVPRVLQRFVRLGSASAG